MRCSALIPCTFCGVWLLMVDIAATVWFLIVQNLGREVIYNARYIYSVF